MPDLIVIPVRGGSVGVPHKATRPLADGPSCLERLLVTARSIPDADVVVVTDDGECAAQAIDAGVMVVADPPGANGSRALDYVVHHGVTEYERYQHLLPRPEVVITLQATSPFTSVALVERCRMVARIGGATAITVRDDRALRWPWPAGRQTRSRAPLRHLRQDMAPCWREVGAVIATPRDAVTPSSRFAPFVDLVPVEGPEAIDIDTLDDWAAAEWYVRHEQGVPCRS